MGSNPDNKKSYRAVYVHCITTPSVTGVWQCSVKCVGTTPAIELQIVKYSRSVAHTAAAVSLSPLPQHLLAAGTACAETKKFHIHVLCKLQGA